MTQNQIKLLKLLGYTDTQEDGAILQNKSFSGMDAYIWKDAKFEHVLSNHTKLVEHATYHKMASTLRAMAK